MNQNESENSQISADYIPLMDCKHGFLYEIDSRNLNFGVFNEKNNGFIGIRQKFSSRFLFTEYHWDTGEPYGTVKPKKELRELPSDIEINHGNENKKLFEFLEDIEFAYGIEKYNRKTALFS